MTLYTDAAKQAAIRSIHTMAGGTLADFAEVAHPEAVNREAVAEPPAARGRGPEAFLATAQWLHAAFADLAWEIHDVVAEGEVVVLHTTMSGRQTGTFVVYGPDGSPAQAFPATGRRFAVTQTHWIRLRDGLAIEHWANRDDQGMAEQLGWVPPTPAYLVRMAITTRRARRAAAWVNPAEFLPSICTRDQGF